MVFLCIVARRVPEPEDILGSVRVENGVMIAHTYEPMPVHRLVTRNGLFQLSETMQSALVAAQNSS